MDDNHHSSEQVSSYAGSHSEKKKRSLDDVANENSTNGTKKRPIKWSRQMVRAHITVEIDIATYLKQL